MPILTNPLTNEPYIPLPSHPHIILTPPRAPNASDRAALLALLNNPAIYPFLESTPVPYLAAHADEYLQRTYDDAVRALDTAAGTPDAVDGMPFVCIRDTSTSAAGSGDAGGGWGTFIGNISLSRYQFYEFKRGSAERAAAVSRNEAWPAGSEEIVWGFGDYLSPAYHGRGIMTAAIAAVIREWAIPRLNARVLKASAYADNAASMRVFEKNGFRLEWELEDWAVVPENRGGGVKSIVVLKWSLDEGDAQWGGGID
ncbi:GNAT family N-acetyltransferase [Aspergillus clavatus NRRL 1]|uniref:Acetyltransferase, GNAT family family n=1 Tax=Aspergillus clavatus (strain ATCC 1007 / CBS 513.65 / DSM 816 / NCTC 3887 / NRRL 1 / QM 1276 / 107) TaxID=344612 RepID=A1CTF6_ASPCL|nr:acetyltransferase, GNAT family [Aspergillus clavatus NRRL 1]EAW06593.1 acetyltransferase, GNAT family family [Aspergillus clavatus NRRL 1]